jgi:hypothetical protein
MNGVCIVLKIGDFSIVEYVSQEYVWSNNKKTFGMQEGIIRIIGILLSELVVVLS